MDKKVRPSLPRGEVRVLGKKEQPERLLQGGKRVFWGKIARITQNLF